MIGDASRKLMGAPYRRSLRGFLVVLLLLTIVIIVLGLFCEAWVPFGNSLLVIVRDGGISIIYFDGISTMLGIGHSRFNAQDKPLARSIWAAITDTPQIGFEQSLLVASGPLWPIGAILFLLVLWMPIGCRDTGGGYCTNCGYDLTANTLGRCPECGLTFLDTRTVASPE